MSFKTIECFLRVSRKTIECKVRVSCKTIECIVRVSCKTEECIVRMSCKTIEYIVRVSCKTIECIVRVSCKTIECIVRVSCKTIECIVRVSCKTIERQVRTSECTGIYRDTKKYNYTATIEHKHEYFRFLTRIQYWRIYDNTFRVIFLPSHKCLGDARTRGMMTQVPTLGCTMYNYCKIVHHCTWSLRNPHWF